MMKILLYKTVSAGVLVACITILTTQAMNRELIDLSRQTQRIEQKVNGIEASLDKRFQEVDDKFVLLFNKLNTVLKVIRKPQSRVYIDDTGADDEYNLGKIAYLGHHNKEVNFDSALIHFKKAATQDENLEAKAGAIAYIGLMYYKGHGVPQVFEQALENFQLVLALIIKTSEPKELEKNLKGKISPNEEAQAIAWYYLGKIFLLGQAGGRKNIDDALVNLTKASTQTVDLKIAAAANFYLGKLYFKGSQHVKADHSLAQTRLKKVEENSEFQVRAWSMLGIVAYDQKDFEHACSYFKKIAEKESSNAVDLKSLVKARYYLAERFFANSYGEINKDTALKYLEQASTPAARELDDLTAALARKSLSKYT